MPAKPEDPPQPRDWATITGAVLQGLVLGVLLFVAVFELLYRLGGTTVFRYQGF